MNERIDEIAFEAGCHRHKYCNPKHPDLEGYIISQEALDKFAELIVKRCINIAYEYDKPKLSGPGLAIASNIKSHFDIYIEEDEVQRCPKCNEEWSGTSCGINDCGWITGVK